MSRKIYDTVYKSYNNYKEIKNRYSFINTVTETYKLLLQIIADKTDDEFNDFYMKYMLKFQLKQYYFARLFNPYKECNFNSYDNVYDFIDKSCSSGQVNEENYYLELNTYLIDINLKLKNIEQEKEIKVIAKPTKKEEVKKKKKTISATIKRLVWNTNIGEDIGKSKCLCCNSTDITQMSFNCGHIIAEANGGETIVSNLKPICQNCNSSMGSKNMNEFMKSLK